MSIPEVTHAGEPAWLSELRSKAQLAASQAGLPTAAEEEWRYSPIDEIDISAYSPVAAPSEPKSSQFIGDDAVSDAAVLIDTVDGHVVSVDVRREAGVQVVQAAKSADAVPVGGVYDGELDVFAQLNLALAPDPLVIRIARGAVIDGPIVVRHHISADGALIAPRTTVVAGEDCEVTVIEVVTSDEVKALVLPVTELALSQAARVKYLVVQNLAPSVWQIASQVSTIEADGLLATNAVALGGAYARLRTDTRMVGRGAEGDITAVYLGEGDQSLDFRTFQTHVAPHTRSNLEFRGAVDDNSRSIYTGLIRIEKDARAVEAFQTNRTIKLSETAWAESVPNLEIENNDVKCSHASAVGPIDAEQQFYLESRGVPTAIAERLVVQGFFSDIVARTPHAGIGSVVDSLIASRLQNEVAS